MLWPREEFHAAYGQIKHDGIQSGGTSILVLVALDVDALCACEILTGLFKADFLSYTLLPVRGYEDILRIRDTRLRDAEGNVKASDLRSVVMINCGAIVNVTQLLLLPREVKCYIFDSHRPIHLANIYDANQQIVVFDDGAQSIDDFPADGSDIDNDDLDASDEDDDDEEDGDDDDDGDEGEDARTDDEEGDEGEAEVDFGAAKTAEDGAESEAIGGDGGEDDNEDETQLPPDGDAMSPSSDKKRKRSDLSDGDDEDATEDAVGSPKKAKDDENADSVDEPPSQGGDVENEKTARRRRREEILRYYRGSFNGAPAATIAFELAQQLNASHRDLLWFAIIGLTKQFVLEEIDSDNYNLMIHRFQDEVLALDTSSVSGGPAESDEVVNPAYDHGRITFEEEYRFILDFTWTKREDSPVPSSILLDATRHLQRGNRVLKHGKRLRRVVFVTIRCDQSDDWSGLDISDGAGFRTEAALRRSQIQLMLKEWAGNDYIHGIRCVVLPEGSPTCAVLAWSLRGNDAESAARTAARLGEFVRVLELVARSGTGLDLLHSLMNQGRTPIGCPLTGWCAFCDGGDRTVELRLRVKSSPALLEDALFDWDEDDATEAFAMLQDAVAALEVVRDAEEDARWDGPVIHISLKFSSNSWNARRNSMQQLRRFFARYTAAMAHEERPLFRISRVHTKDLDNAMMAVIAESNLPVVHGSFLGNAAWTWALQPSRSGRNAAVWAPSSTLLAKGNVISLGAQVKTRTDEKKTQCFRLHEILRSQSTTVKTLCMEYQFRCDERTREQLNHAIADTFFSRSTLAQLDQLTIIGELAEEDVLAIVRRLSLASTSAEPPPARIRELVCEDWQWKKDSIGNDRHRLRGATFAKLLRLIGGVESLCLKSDLPVAEIPTLTSCRSLDVSVSCVTWSGLPSLADGGASSTPATESLVETLVLRPRGHHIRDNRRTAKRLLQHLGRQLRSLSIIPHSVLSRFCSETATAIVLHCPNLEKLHVQYADSSFCTALVDAIAASGSCRIKRLSLRSRFSLKTFSAVVATLREPRHPLTRTLRSLRLDIYEGEYDDIEALGRDAREMLRVNETLRDVTIRCDESVDWSGLEISESDREFGIGVALAPLRHRLALLSVLSPRGVPCDIFVDVLWMAGRGICRLRLEDADEVGTLFEPRRGHNSDY
ncbi:hypothetical protein ATCC90586_002784 [Pythium insidiosum]|nr:hypothetical protein ATCC90586_002784 [Pythium insidiosum]